MVLPKGIEPLSSAPETDALSVKLGQHMTKMIAGHAIS